MARTRFEGLDRMNRRIDRIPVEVRRAMAENTLAGAEEVAALQRRYAPKDSGDLVNSIKVTPGGQRTPAYSQPGGSRLVPEHGAHITVGNTAVRYPHLLEYGTLKAPAQPFFWPAWRALRNRVKSRISRNVRKVVKSLWGGS